MAAIGSPSSSSSSSSKTGSSSSMGDTVGRPTDDECRYAGWVDSVCRTYRSCRSCLALEGCRISMEGYCESIPVNGSIAAKYNSVYDFHAVYATNLTIAEAYQNPNVTISVEVTSYQRWVFPASDVRYCPTSDYVCQGCISSRYWSDNVDSRFCVGDDGCVCIANCGRADDESTCPRTSYVSVPYESKRLHSGTLILVLAIAAAIGVAVSYVYRHCTKVNRTPSTTQAEPSVPPMSPSEVETFYSQGIAIRTPTPFGSNATLEATDLQLLRPQPSRPEASVPQRDPPTVSRPQAQLELYGWISHRQHLIDAETRRLNGADDFVPPRNQLPGFPPR